MDRPQLQKGRVNIDLNHDYISNLPADLKEKILVKLSINEAVRTSILSSKWKDSWTSLPNLVFKEKSTESRLVNLVDRVLLVHQGLIRLFVLVSKHACNEAIGCWIHALSTNGIEELHLTFKGRERCEIPSSRFFSCTALKFVCMSGCIINVPQFFNGFTLLHTLRLSNFNLSGFGIEKLVSSCPLLEHLELRSFFQEGCLRILAPNLTYLDILGGFHDICLETPKLVSGVIWLITDNDDFEEFSVAKHMKESNITRALGRLSSIQRLEVRGEFFDYLAVGPIPENLPAIFNHLTEIFVLLRIHQDMMPTALCLFQNAPNLKVLRIEFWDFEDMDEPHVQASWELKAIQDCLFKDLEVVNIMCEQINKLPLQSSKWILEFAKLVLSTAPMLEELNVTDLGDAMVVFEELKLFPKLSVKCKIVLVEEVEQESDGDEDSDA
ncbi:F-box/FBD/LRR-repeat protein At1g13570-like [Carex rostrata]